MLNEIDLSRVDLNLLVLFEAVYEERHVTRAADRLSLSPSAVSHGMGRLRRLMNDPLFIRTPKGVAANERAVMLAPAVAAILGKVREIVADTAPFDPATSTRRFAIGAPDGVSAVFLQPLLSTLRVAAPGIDLAVKHLLPSANEPDPQRAWRGVFAELESGALNLAVVPLAAAPARFAARKLYAEDFVLVTRPDHPFALQPTLDTYCSASHLVVSASGDAMGFVDEILAKEGRARRVALTAPNFMYACAIVSDTDLVCAVPRHFAALYAGRFGLRVHEPPLALGHFRLTAFLPAPALADAGIGWLLETLVEVAEPI
ncbi:LysR family transcriptional regulator [Sphingomonas sp. MS122]|uniref:LysR family transcriptional regulator n=1 Tax=Sphingomonas sp. MS122 TaxID=3412683 RepID=UPI003C2AEF60